MILFILKSRSPDSGKQHTIMRHQNYPNVKYDFTSHLNKIVYRVILWQLITISIGFNTRHKRGTFVIVATNSFKYFETERSKN